MGTESHSFFLGDPNNMWNNGIEINTDDEPETLAMTTKSTRNNHAHIGLAVLFSLLLTGCASKAVDALMVSVDRTTDNADHFLYKEVGSTQMMLQSAAGDIEKVKSALDSGADPNEGNVNGYSALMFAAEHGNLTISKMLIDYGADIGIKNKYDHTPLFVASNKRIPNSRSYLEAMELAHIPYVGEGNHTGVINYLMSIDAPIYESLGYAYDAAYTGRAFFNIAQMYERAQKHAFAQEYFGIAMRGFLVASDLEERRYQIGEEIHNARTRAAVGFAVTGMAYEAYFNRSIPYSSLGIDPQIVARSLGRPRQASSSEENIYLRKSRDNLERARAVGLFLECYTNDTPDDVVGACLKQATTEFDDIDGQITLSPWQ